MGDGPMKRTLVLALAIAGIPVAVDAQVTPLASCEDMRPESPLEDLRTCADQGDVRAQPIPGYRHRTGEGVSVDDAEAVRWGYWKAEDCKKVSDASGLFLYFSGELLREADKLKKEGKEKEADESYKGVLFLSELATNYAKNFAVYCK